MSKNIENINLESFKKIVLINKTIYIKGFIFYKNVLINIENKNDIVEEIMHDIDSEDELRNIKGQFTIVIDNNDKIYILTDIIRTYPVFYKTNKNTIDITDDINKINNLVVNNKLASCFITSGYCYDRKTIYNDVYAVQAAEIIIINKHKLTIRRKRYFRFISKPKQDAYSVHEFVLGYNKIFGNVIDRMLKTIKECGNFIVPLSGGHDSRQIINVLYKKGIKNVICFSYGVKGNIQSTISEKAAKAVGYSWCFVEYTEDKWNKLHKNGKIEQYFDLAFQGISTPHLQDFLAIDELLKKKILSKQDVIIPGHALDMISGGHFTNIDLKLKTVKDAITRAAIRHGKVYKKNDVLKSEHFRILSDIYNGIKIAPIEFQEYINWQERQAKFIVNSCRVYEYYGLEYRLPFWDRELVELFLTLPYEQRIERKLYKESERNGILIKELSSIQFEDEINKKTSNIDFKKYLKLIIPQFIAIFLMKTTNRKNYVGEALNQIYALRGKTVLDIIGPLTIYPKETHKFIKTVLKRPTNRIDYHLLSGLYTIGRVMQRIKQ